MVESDLAGLSRLPVAGMLPWWMLGWAAGAAGPLSRLTCPSPSTITPFTRFTALTKHYRKVVNMTVLRVNPPKEKEAHLSGPGQVHLCPVVLARAGVGVAGRGGRGYARVPEVGGQRRLASKE